MENNSSKTIQEEQSIKSEVKTSENYDNLQSSQLTAILSARDIKQVVSTPEMEIKDRISIEKHEMDISAKTTYSELVAVKRSKSPKESAIKFWRRLQKRSFLARGSHEKTSAIRISKLIVDQPKEEEEWHAPEKKPMTGTSFREVNDYRRKLREQLHVPTKRELKRSHVPYHVSLCSELEEDGFADAANFIRYLTDFDEQRRECPGDEDCLEKYEPKLKDNKSHLKRLAIGLTEATMAKINENIIKESNCLLQLANYFTKENKSWWWIAQKLFEKCINALKDVRTDGGENEANARCCYGHFLLTEVHDSDKAKEHLQIAHSLSSGKSWKVSEGPTDFSTLIYINACNLLYEALVQTAIKIREKDPKAAVRLCNLALRRAKEGGSEEGQARVLLELGICMMTEDIQGALEVFHKLLNLNLGPNNLTIICNCHLQVALCYKQLGDSEKALQHLETFKNIAETNKLTEQLAAVYRYLGEFHLNMDSAHQAKSYLETSFNLYLELGIVEEIKQSRVLAAIGAGHAILPDYINLIYQCGDPRNTEAFTKLLKWKISNDPFWETEGTATGESDVEDVESEISVEEQSIETNKAMIS